MARRRKPAVASAKRSKGKKAAASSIPDVPKHAATSTVSTLEPPPFAASTLFTKFPLELRLMIYEFAYKDQKPLKVRCMHRSQPRRFVYNHLMISKQWFNEAIEMFARGTEFEFANAQEMAEILEIHFPHYFARSITSLSLHVGQDRAGHVTNFGIHQQAMEALQEHLPSLKTFRVLLPSDYWTRSMLMTKIAGETTNTFFAHCHITGIFNIRGLDPLMVEVCWDGLKWKGPRVIILTIR